jgi:hypothetical protein
MLHSMLRPFITCHFTVMWNLFLLTCSPVTPQVCNTDKSLSLPLDDNDNHRWRSPWHSTVSCINAQQSNTFKFCKLPHDSASLCRLGTTSVSSAGCCSYRLTSEALASQSSCVPSSSPHLTISSEAVWLLPAGYPVFQLLVVLGKEAVYNVRSERPWDVSS